MKREILSKMEQHVSRILEKPSITNEEYNLISSYLAVLEYEETKHESIKVDEESREFLESLALELGGTL